ncbi:MAG: S41 family peptidase [Vicinamibacterales bacterium]
MSVAGPTRPLVPTGSTRRTRTRSAMAGLVVGLAVAALATGAGLRAQGLSANDSQRVKRMLQDAYEVVKKQYYDTRYHGLDWDGRYREYQGKVNAAASLNQAVTLIAAFLDGLHDSHTSFYPPARPYRVDYGYRLKVIGDAVFVTSIPEDSDAAATLHPGDEVLAVNGGPVTRETFHTMRYVLGALSPQPSTRLVVRDPAGATRELTVQAKVTPGRQLRDLTGAARGAELDDLILEGQREREALRSRVVEVGDVMIWRLPEFIQEDHETDALFARARTHASLILDLRGNPGGLVVTLQRMLGNVFDRDVAIGDRVSRGHYSALTAKSRGADAYGGRLIVLVDSASASSSEIFARVVQIEQRGAVMGDRSAGAVMEARMFPFAQGAQFAVVYGFSVTSADLVMTDGRSLERAGVVPDHVVLPTPADLVERRDPVLARAAALVGLDLDPAAAARIFDPAGR